MSWWGKVRVGSKVVVGNGWGGYGAAVSSMNEQQQTITVETESRRYLADGRTTEWFTREVTFRAVDGLHHDPPGFTTLDGDYLSRVIEF